MASTQQSGGPNGIEAEDKVLDEHLEVVDHDDPKHESHAWNIMPESLRNMGEEERALLEKKMVRKMDMIIL